jgi:hypothetical protein
VKRLSGILWHLLHMRLLRLSLTLLAAVGLAGCFQSSTIIHVNADGSGTIDERMLLTGAALAQLRAFAAFGGGGGQDVNPISEDQARSAATSMGSGVTYVSSTPISSGDAQGRAIVYAFTDINQVRISQQPPAPGGVTIRAPGVNTADGQAVTFALARQPDDNMLLRINVPKPSMPPADTPPPASAGPRSSPQQIAMIKQLIAGAHLSIAVEPSGHVVRTSSPFVEGQRVTLLDLDFDEVTKDEALVSRLQGVRSVDDAKAALKDVPGLKINFDPEITIEFTPEK